MSARRISTLVVSSALLFAAGAVAQSIATSNEVPAWAKPQSIYDASNRSEIGPITKWPAAAPMDTPTDTSAAYTVSLKTLEHAVPRKAVREWGKAEKAREKGQLDVAIQHLTTAVGIDPEFIAARNNLGALYLASGKPKEAAGQLETAIKIDPQAALAYSNLAVAYLMMSHFADAERAARQATDLDRIGVRAHMVLGFALVMQEKFTDEAMQHLRKSKDEFPQSQLLCARIEAARGQVTQARATIQEYLATRDTSARDLAEEWLGVLNHLRLPVQAKAQDQPTVTSASATEGEADRAAPIQ